MTVISQLISDLYRIRSTKRPTDGVAGCIINLGFLLENCTLSLTNCALSLQNTRNLGSKALNWFFQKYGKNEKTRVGQVGSNVDGYESRGNKDILLGINKHLILRSVIYGWLRRKLVWKNLSSPLLGTTHTLLISSKKI